MLKQKNDQVHYVITLLDTIQLRDCVFFIRIHIKPSLNATGSLVSSFVTATAMCRFQIVDISFAFLLFQSNNRIRGCNTP